MTAEVTVSGSPSPAAFVEQMLASTGAADGHALGTERFRRLRLGEALRLLAPAPG